MKSRKNAAAQDGKQRRKAPPGDDGFVQGDTAERIVSAAARLFADRGYDGTSVKDICELAGVNIAAINYHFESKDNLCRRIIERFSAERLVSARRTLQAPGNPDDFKVRLEIFLGQTIEAMIKQKDIVRLIQQEMEKPDSRCSAMLRDTFMKHGQTLMEFFDQARKSGITTADVDPHFSASFLMSHIVQQTRSDGVFRKTGGPSLSDEKYRGRWVQQTVRILTSGVLAK